MSKKELFKYNPATDNYERVHLPRKSRVWIALRNPVAGIIIGIAVFYAASFWIGFPREKMLKQENEQLEAELEILNRRLDAALGIMEDIAARDNNFYRVVMQAERISDAQRYAGLENQRRYNDLNSLSDAALIKSLSNKMNMLERQMYIQINSFDLLRDLAGQQKDRLAHIPAIQPIAEKHLKQMASGFGYRVDPVYGTGKFHEGMDFAADTGTPVYATGDARVTTAGWHSGYGNVIVLDHGYRYTTRYAHLSKILVSPGQQVKRGDLIGKVGNTGKSTGSHLHYEVRHNDIPQNPINYYFFDMTPEQYNEMIQLAENAGHVMD